MEKCTQSWIYSNLLKGTLRKIIIWIHYELVQPAIFESENADSWGIAYLCDLAHSHLSTWVFGSIPLVVALDQYQKSDSWQASHYAHL